MELLNMLCEVEKLSNEELSNYDWICQMGDHQATHRVKTIIYPHETYLCQNHLEKYTKSKANEIQQEG